MHLEVGVVEKPGGDPEAAPQTTWKEKSGFSQQPRVLPRTERRRNRGPPDPDGWGSESLALPALVTPLTPVLRVGPSRLSRRESCESVPACGLRHTHDDPAG